jgi:NAD(P)-dependent dehydrogenase (short-subunit alcohol dehydrogenase family)
MPVPVTKTVARPSTMPVPERIVVTGVSRGLGRALVDGFVARRHVVFGCARSTEAIGAALGIEMPESDAGMLADGWKQLQEQFVPLRRRRLRLRCNSDHSATSDS